MSRPIITAAAVILLSAASTAGAEPVARADAAIATQGNAALATLQADLVAGLPTLISLPQLNEQEAETVALGYLIAAQGDAALERVERQLPATIQADLELPELRVTTHFASAAPLPQSPAEI